MTSISDFIVDSLVTYLDTNLSTTLDDAGYGEPAVKAGRLYTNPVEGRTNVLIHIGHPYEEGWYDSPVGEAGYMIRQGPAYMARVEGRILPIGEVGGFEYWIRRFTIELRFFFTRTRESQDESREEMDFVRNAILYHFRRWRPGASADDFSEGYAGEHWVTSTNTSEGGGSDRQVWRHMFIKFNVLTRVDLWPE